MPVFLIELHKKVFLANEWNKRMMYDSTINSRHSWGTRLFCTYTNSKINNLIINRVETSLIQIELLPENSLAKY